MKLTRRGFVAGATAGGLLACRTDPHPSDPKDHTGSPTGSPTETPTGTPTSTPTGTPTEAGSAPDLDALPEATYGVGDWSGFLAAMTGVNAEFVDVTGVRMRRLTDATTPLREKWYGMTYASGGAKISQAFGDDLDTYWLVYQVFDSTGSRDLDTRLAKVRRGVGVVSDVSFAPPSLSAGRLSYSFSYRPGETHILYYVGDDQSLHRFDVEAGTPAPDERFSGPDGTWPDLEMAPYPGWLQMTWDGGRICWLAPYADPVEMHHLNLDTGVHTVYDDPPTLAQVNDIRLSRGSANVCPIATDPGTKAFWFVDENVVTEFTAAIPGTQGHCDCGEDWFYTCNADGTHVSFSKSTLGSAPDSDGGPWSGSPEPLATGEAPDRVLIDGDFHADMTWDQRGVGGDEAFCIDCDATSPYKNAAEGWSPHDGAIWGTRVSWGIYGSDPIGVSGVLEWDGSTEAGRFTGHLVESPTLGDMAEGTWFWDGERLFVWMPDGESPDARVRIVNGSLLGESIGYLRAADGRVTRLCFTYRNEGTYNYVQSAFANWSIDGKLCVFSSNLGVQAGRTDLILVEVPLG